YGLQRIVEMLEFFAAAEAGRALLRTEPVGVLSLVKDVVDRWGERLPSGRISGQFPLRIPDVVADPRWLRISVNELIGNAVEYSPDDSPITVTAAAVSNGGGPGAEIAVADRGGGMSAEDIERCFGDFVQGDSSDTRSHGGLGLGLSLVRRVAEAHGGNVAVESTIGKGSTFSIFLPSRPSESTRAVGAA
ncbi:MAG TPA: HAMP domain-containing sensor histidine kinase, partial [Acidimicrobiales bacterium]|nr:HAMP domain-containing sensor histidine kinase [Acidimicrobiales bacterium]